MMNPNRLMASVIAITAAALLAGALLGTAFMAQPATPAKFSIGSCFVHKSPRHKWEPPSDGMVFDMDATTYLVVYAVYLRSKVVDVAYVGHERNVEMFDQEYNITECPPKW